VVIGRPNGAPTRKIPLVAAAASGSVKVPNKTA
jgi:hypothetical protein